MNEKLVVFTLAFVIAVANGCVDGPGEATGGGSGGGSGGGTGGSTGAGGGEPVADAGQDGGKPSDPCEGPPGLYADDDCEVIADGLFAFTPRFVLWTDGAQKERFISLPPGTHIDASDPDNWIFPVGTRLWKMIIIAGKRVETRVLEKVQEGNGIAAWDYVSYAWDESQRKAKAVPQGVIDTLGMTHDIPSLSDCEQCHAPAATDMVVGFSAIQLNHEGTELSLEDLNEGGWFEDGQTISTIDADVPGDATERAALGYLHGNCAHCHADGIVPAPVGLKMRLYVGDTNVEGTEAYLTAVNQLSTWVAPGPTPLTVDRIEPGVPEQSAIWLRLSSGEMPLIGVDVVDPQGVAAVGDWIASLAEAQ